MRNALLKVGIMIDASTELLVRDWRFWDRSCEVMLQVAFRECSRRDFVSITAASTHYLRDASRASGLTRFRILVMAASS